MIVKVALCGICVCIINVLLRQYNKSFVIFAELIFVGAVVSLIMNDAADGVRRLTDLFTLSTSQSKIIVCLLKGAVICIVTKLACDVSYESGNIIVGDIIELAGRIILLVISLPFIESVVKTAVAFAS
ncbi:MAG: hypothetical protein IKB94_04140 [Clostridia bacterium]|nr:hypothetical protein [Clostridia bacterium]MBR2893025.1 hypothetical protein [Clostridia bacterium]